MLTSRYTIIGIIIKKKKHYYTTIAAAAAEAEHGEYLIVVTASPC